MAAKLGLFIDKLSSSCMAGNDYKSDLSPSIVKAVSGNVFYDNFESIVASA